MAHVLAAQFVIERAQRVIKSALVIVERIHRSFFACPYGYHTRIFGCVALNSCLGGRNLVQSLSVVIRSWCLNPLLGLAILDHRLRGIYHERAVTIILRHSMFGHRSHRTAWLLQRCQVLRQGQHYIVSSTHHDFLVEIRL